MCVIAEIKDSGQVNRTQQLRELITGSGWEMIHWQRFRGLLDQAEQSLARGKVEEAETLVSKAIRAHYNAVVARDPSAADRLLMHPNLVDELRRLMRPSDTEIIDQQWHNEEIPRITQIAEKMGLPVVEKKTVGQVFINDFGKPIPVQEGFTYLSMGRQPRKIVGEFWNQALSPEAKAALARLNAKFNIT